MARARLGSYTLLDVIGRGSMGVVYRTLDPRSQRPLAIKVLRQDLIAEDPNFLEHFRAEARTAQSLVHSGIVAVHEYGEELGSAYMVMEYVEGRSLRELFGGGGAFDLAGGVTIVSQLLAALQYAHERGVWHRDVNPGNILVTPDGQVKVTDFGIARSPEVMGAPDVTGTSEVMGTPGYIAPETYLTDAFDGRADLFATGAVLYQLLTGVPAFTGTAQEIMVKVCYETPALPSTRNRKPELQPFDAIVLKALARDPEQRFASAQEFREALLAAAP